MGQDVAGATKPTKVSKTAVGGLLRTRIDQARTEHHVDL